MTELLHEKSCFSKTVYYGQILSKKVYIFYNGRVQ